MPLPEDKLTKLISEDELREQLKYEMERARRYGWELGLFLVEPDLPPDVGPDMQYPVLRRLAAVCNQVMRSVDKGIRCGSGIIYILPETPQAGVETASDKIKVGFVELSHEHPVTGEQFKCGIRRAASVFAGKDQKQTNIDDAYVRLLLRQLKDGLTVA